MASPLGQSRDGSQRPFGVRLYLAVAFAGVALISAGLSYVLTTGSGEEAADRRALTITLGRTVDLADRIGGYPRKRGDAEITKVHSSGFSAWVFNRRGGLVSPRISRRVRLSEIDGHRMLVRAALAAERDDRQLADNVTLVWRPLFRGGVLAGALLVRAERPEAVSKPVEEVRGDRLTALAIALGVALLISFLIASAITYRVKRLAGSARKITEGRLDEPLEGAAGRDEIADLGHALETMRGALRETFGALRSERDRLSAIFDALDEAVMVVGPSGDVRFFNPAAAPLIDDGHASPRLFPWLRRALERGAVEHDGLNIDERVYAIGARRLPAEGAVLAVVRDRTDELRREIAEHEFVSNAAHELRNPIAGISSAIEVLRAGAKDDPDAREHFLTRLGEDTERVSRLTDSLLTLARMDSVTEVGAEDIDVEIAVEDAARAVSAPDGIEVAVEVSAELAAQGDSVLLRQVLIGLMTNAFKNTPPPGAVTLRARRSGADEVLIEVSDTGKGIAAEEIDRIFDRFYRGSGALEQEGFGLGLSIAKRMVNVMGGEIGVESEPGVGSTFWVRLPAAKPAATPVA